MNKLFKAITFVAFSALAISTVTSCKKEEDEGLLPNIGFKTGNDYISADKTVSKNTAVKIGITASKSEDKDVLTKFTVTRSLDGGADSTLVNNTLSGNDANNYSYDLNTTTRNVAGTEKYTFTVVNRDGLINKASVTLTVQ